ncbi:MAG: class I SAM-dependent methyltransferase [Solirubrobacteraceae bacterium]|nr:class I SAM-dependent methyltransferase [Solirubrobacteraceae bacterium]
MAYADWHGQPGYWRDITRHFDPATRLLDLGCGSGWIADHFSDYTGIDGSEEMVAAAAERGRPVRLGDVTQPLDFPDASFDGVILKDLLEHVPDPVAVVLEAKRVLRPGGLVFASSPDAQRWVWDDYTHRRPFSRKSFRLLFADQGYASVQVGYESVMPGTSIISGGWTGDRRPLPLRWAAWLPFVRRNVWAVARV